jgi:hypothetical protein
MARRLKAIDRPVGTVIWEQIYSIEKIAGYNPVTEYWFPLAFHDPGLLHCFIGCAYSYVSFNSNSRDGARGWKHMHEAITIVNQRLQVGKNAITGGTIIIVVGMALLEVRLIFQFLKLNL